MNRVTAIIASAAVCTATLLSAPHANAAARQPSWCGWRPANSMWNPGEILQAPLNLRDGQSPGFPRAVTAGSGGRADRRLAAALSAGVILGFAGTAGLMLVSGWQVADGRSDAVPRPTARAITVVEDGTDPKIAGCYPGRTILQSVPVVLGQGAVEHDRRLPVGTTVGMVELVYSPHCAGAWAHFDPAPGLNPDPHDTIVATVTIEADRPVDNTMAQFRLNHVDSTYSDMLLTGLGCVTASARVAISGQNSTATGQTSCLPPR